MSSTVPPIEIGSLSTVSPSSTQFIGSSSGIFFVNTVRRAFTIGKVGLSKETTVSEPYDPDPIDNCIVGDNGDTSEEEENSAPETTEINRLLSRNYGINSPPLGLPPSREVAGELVMTYFRAWHPIFPFIHGPTFSKELDRLYTDDCTVDNCPQNKGEVRRKICQAIIFQCVFNIGALDRGDIKLAKECTIESPSALLPILTSLTSGHDISCLQALLSAEIYLIATMSLQAASTVAGMLMRSIFHAGLHRCPFRYVQLSRHDCEIRKRLFWSAYTADRYLSQALGLPLGVHDLDIDVCLPGEDELHRPVPIPEGSEATPARTDISSHLPQRNTDIIQSELSHVDVPRRHGEEALANYVAYGRLTGRVLEMFHKSISVRTVAFRDVLELTSDIHSFWNCLPQQLQDSDTNKNRTKCDANGKIPEVDSLGLFFTISYQQLVLLINRPFLSLDPSTTQFRSSLQICIGASRTIIHTIKEQTEYKHCISWPGILSATWMSGLILAFACALRLYPMSKGVSEIETSLQLLQALGAKWTTAKHCHATLRVLLEDLHLQATGRPSQLREAPLSKQLPNSGPYHRNSRSANATMDRAAKRQRTSNVEEANDHGQDSSRANFPSSDQSYLAPDVLFDMPESMQFDDARLFQGQDSVGGPLYTQDIFSHLSWESLFPDCGVDDNT